MLQNIAFNGQFNSHRITHKTCIFWTQMSKKLTCQIVSHLSTMFFNNLEEYT